jgi:hypothetical protein
MTSPPDLPPLWEQYAGLGHNGGPAVRPASATPELQERIFDAMADGVPLWRVCQEEGMPEMESVQRWQREDPSFARACDFARQCGNEHLAAMVVKEADLLCETHGADHARQVFELRKRQLAQMDPEFFGGDVEDEEDWDGL